MLLSVALSLAREAPESGTGREDEETALQGATTAVCVGRGG